MLIAHEISPDSLDSVATRTPGRYAERLVIPPPMPDAEKVSHMYRVSLLALSALALLAGCYGDNPERVVNVYDVNKDSVLAPPSETPETPAESEQPAGIEDPDAGQAPAPAAADLADAGTPPDSPPEPVEPPSPAPAPEDAPAAPAASEPPAEPVEVSPPPAPVTPAENELAGEPAPPQDAADTAPAIDPAEKEEVLRPVYPPNPDDTKAELQRILDELDIGSAGDSESDTPPDDPDIPQPPASEETPAEEPSAEEPSAEEPSAGEAVPAEEPSADESPAGEAPTPAPEVPPAEPEAEPMPAMPLDKAAEMRTWVDSTGRLKIKASFIRFENESAILHSESGEELKIPIKRFSREDQQFLQQIQRGAFGI